MSATLHDLRSALCELSVDRSLTPQDLKLISKGQVLKDEGGEATLASLGLKPHSSVLALRTAAATASRSDPSRSGERLARLMAYLERVTGGSSSASGRLVLEKHDGSSVAIDEQSRKALVTALALHQHGAMVMAKGKHAEALQELLAAEEAAAAVQDDTLLSSIDNVALLLLDIVWCSFKLQDRNRLGVSADRLKRCRAQLTHAYGPDKQRAKELQAGIFSPELRTYLRLEVLEGVVAFHTQDHATARERLAAARSRWQRLQVPQVAVDMLTGMGFTADEAQLALQVAGPENVASAALVATQHRQQAQARAEKQASRDRRMARAQGMGRTAGGHALDSEHLATLTDQGHVCGLAAEALKQANNDLPAAQAALASEDERSALMLTAARTHTRRGHAARGQASAASSSSAGGSSAAGSSARQGRIRKRRRSWESAFPPVDEVLVAQLMSLGFQECFAHAALLLHRGQLEPATLTLHNWARRDADVKAAAEPPPPRGACHGADGSSPGGGSARTAHPADEEGAASELAGTAAHDSSEGEEEARAAEDKEMEEELAAGLGGAGGSALQQPPDLSEEAAALALHLRLLGMEVPEGMA